MRVLDLFSGIGGFSLGLERSGMKTVAFCEIDPFCRNVLNKHWPDIPIYKDIKELTGERVLNDVGTVDVVCGGFPCQDISSVGQKIGMEGARSGLWSELFRIICEIRPRYAIVENVSGLLHRGISDVLRDLASIGHDTEWHCIQAADVGAPHIRDRVWIVSHTSRQPLGRSGQSWAPVSQILANTHSQWELQSQGSVQKFRRRLGDSSWWNAEPSICRVANGIPDQLDRNKALGNAVVPQIPELIGHAILEAEKKRGRRHETLP